MIAADLRLAEARFAVIDIETTGLRAGWDRVVELAIFHCGGGEEPRLAFDSIIRPRREVGATEVHGITALDLVTAPTIEQVVGNIGRALAGRIVVAHNASFDLRFLEIELERAGLDLAPPFIDTMFLLPALGIAPRMSLGQLRLRMELPTSPIHIAAEDATATGLLLQRCLGVLGGRGLVGVGELAQLQGTDSFAGSLHRPLPMPLTRVEGMTQSRAARLGWSTSEELRSPPAVSYTDALMAALADGVVTDEEMHLLENIRDEAGLFGDQLRAIHAHALGWLLNAAASDQVVTEAEDRAIAGAMRALKTLGWAPGTARMRRERAALEAS